VSPRLSLVVSDSNSWINKVQLQTLTAVVKLFLKKPDTSQGIVQRVLNTATKDCESPDVRDRAYIYWRLLSMDPAAAKVRRDRLFFVIDIYYY
jgi:vesicle coat complex subunit